MRLLTRHLAQVVDSQSRRQMLAPKVGARVAAADGQQQG